ncbi:L-cystine transporter [Undibacterium fentianense]|uniref:Cation:dicarboxylase symporter family transporter n=1 Tax=Undibacterium fentianense TaxID=2828728 RepID=A0A941DZF0_9BURK|nr:cation:dicarboxylase symporter family transporter [Undibacterium fentianense]MBR7800334.1 cation:dicarboxylase symporter family transporter [Undibacterium fentianense]
MSLPILPIVINLSVATAICGLLYWLQAKHLSFSKRVLIGLSLGILLGAVFQTFYGNGSPIIQATNAYLDIVGTGYVKLLQMVVMPLILVSIISAILKLKDVSSLGKISSLTIGTLMITTMVAAIIGFFMAKLFGLTTLGLNFTSAEFARGQYLEGTLASAKAINFPAMILSFIPENPFLDLTGTRKTSTIAVVIFAILIGVSATSIAEKKAEIFQSFNHFVEVAQAIVMRLVTLILRLTPYGVFALITQVVGKSNRDDILNLINFVLASYSAIFLMFIVHLSIVAACGLNPLRYLQKIFPVLVFAFTSRTSAGAIPLSVQVQQQRLGTPEGIANFAASFGATMGQNGCAGIYPAMLAFMIAPSVGIDPMSVSFVASLVGIIAIGSIGIAGVGGGATFAALIVLSSLDLPVALAGLLISIEPLIDMGRTALNVSGSITAGTVTSKILGETDLTVFNQIPEAIGTEDSDT